MGSGAPSNSSFKFHVGILAWRSDTILVLRPSTVFLLYGPLMTFVPFWGSGSLAGGISPFSDVFLPFFSLFLFFYRASVGEVQVGRGVGERVWIAISSMDPFACDSSS